MSTKSLPTHLKADLILLLVTVLAAAGWIFSRESVAGMPPLLFMALRFTLAGSLMALLGWRHLVRLTPTQWRLASGVGALFGVAMVFWIMGLKLTSHVGVGAFLSNMGLVMVPVISLLAGDRPGKYVYIAMPVAIGGLACLSLDGEFQLGPAEGFFLLSALLLAVMFVLIAHAAARIPTLALTSVQMLCTGVITAVASWPMEPWSLDFTAATWSWFAASLIIATCIRFLLQTHAMGLAAPSHSAIIMILEPVWTAIAAVLWFGEQLGQLQLLGCVLIFCAMLINRWPMLRQWLLQAR
ncbi:DMT family transporter [Halioxenophilus sp. WMMB6]|uniref:DMT family transporter n=1 Tax=Halioxenophilus sp. WMMB6 TaxID=3073815 RepID=UPI00295E5071|nr:DMT family transporter [Halioxenophilus sp. WMMB6]